MTRGCVHQCVMASAPLGSSSHSRSRQSLSSQSSSTSRSEWEMRARSRRVVWRFAVGVGGAGRASAAGLRRPMVAGVGTERLGSERRGEVALRSSGSESGWRRGERRRVADVVWRSSSRAGERRLERCRVALNSSERAEARGALRVMSSLPRSATPLRCARRHPCTAWPRTSRREHDTYEACEPSSVTGQNAHGVRSCLLHRTSRCQKRTSAGLGQFAQSWPPVA